MSKELAQVMGKALKMIEAKNQQAMSRTQTPSLTSLKRELTVEVARAVFEMLKTHQGAIAGIKQGQRGERGEKGDQGIGIAGRDGKDAPAPTLEQITTVVSTILEQNPQIITVAGENIVKEINNLPITPDKQIDAKHIKNLPQAPIDLSSKDTFRGGLKLVWNTQLNGTINGSNTVFTLPGTAPASQDNKYIISTRGVIKTADESDFTVSADGRTFTFTSAPPTGSARPVILLYHGK